MWISIRFSFSDFCISYLSKDEKGQDAYLALLSDWDLDTAFMSASRPALVLKVDLKPFEDSKIYLSNFQ